jgi:hypothetical protein
MGLSHISANGCADHPGSTHPAFAWGAAAISPPPVNAAAIAATM